MDATEGRRALDLGLRRLLLGDARGAAGALADASARLPGEPAALHGLAVALRLQGRVAPDASTAAWRALSAAPGHPVLLTHLALLAWLDRRLDSAHDLLARALASDPAHRVARYYRGLLHRQAGRLREAVDDLEAAAAPGPGALPALVVERIAGQLFDTRLLLDAAPAAPAPVQLAAVAAVSELLLPDGSAQALGLPPADDDGEGPGVVVAPPRGSIHARRHSVIGPAGAAALLHRARRVVALTGAGASADSGLATRKDLWRIFDRDEAVAAMRVRESPAALWRVIEAFLGDQTHAPGTVHQALARLPRLGAIVTQNVDDLHQRAATGEAAPRPVLELHGTLERTRCDRCGADGGASAGEVLRRGEPLPPGCRACGRGHLRPDVVLFGEWVPAPVLAEAARWVTSCDVLLVVGCAMDVAPASELPRLAARAGAAVIEVKRRPSRLSDALGTHLLRGPAAPALLATYDALGALEPLPPLPPAPAGVAPRPCLTVRLPPMGEQVIEGELVTWLRQPGEWVAAGEPLVQIGLDKVSVEVEAPYDGVVAAHLLREGDGLYAGDPIAAIVPDEPPDDEPPG